MKKLFASLICACICLFGIVFHRTVDAAPILTNQEVEEVMRKYRPIDYVDIKIDQIGEVDHEVRTSVSDIIFLYHGISLRNVEKEDELLDIINQVNDNTISTERASWYVAGLNAYEVYDYVINEIDGKRKVGITYNFDRKEDSIQMQLKDLLGEPYDASMKDILFIGPDSQVPLPEPVVVKKFEDGSIKIGITEDTELKGYRLEKGWHTLAEAKEMIRLWNEDDEEGGMFGGGTFTMIRLEWLLLVFIGLMISPFVIVFKLTKKSKEISK